MAVSSEPRWPVSVANWMLIVRMLLVRWTLSSSASSRRWALIPTLSYECDEMSLILKREYVCASMMCMWERLYHGWVNRWMEWVGGCGKNLEGTPTDSDVSTVGPTMIHSPTNGKYGVTKSLFLTSRRV